MCSAENALRSFIFSFVVRLVPIYIILLSVIGQKETEFKLANEKPTIENFRLACIFKKSRSKEVRMNTIRDLQHQKENVDAPFNISQRKSQRKLYKSPFYFLVDSISILLALGPTQSKFPNSSKKSATPGSIKKNR
jgi:hypothetical protein